MKDLKKLWVRILVSLLGGGAANEIFFLATGDATRSREKEGNGITLIAAVFIFGIITLLIGMQPKNKSDKPK
ncbi:hypothetical protein [Ferruginibacter sp. SUN106]|uniref:hypothetical protein n=1 Tax=Ferruginibacter sp. SUN106 TaxID=2978348 RepID=UPI003D35DFCC